MVQQTGSNAGKRQIVNIDNINKSYDQKYILKHIRLQLYKNKITALIGPNGAGKTSLIRIMLGLIEPDSGKIECFLKDISAVLENDFLFADKTGTQNIESFQYYLGYKNTNVEDLADALGLKPHLDKKVQYYSKGMKRKLSILITLLRDTDFIIFDEPTSGIDPESRVQIRNLFLDLKNQGKTLFISTHDLVEIQKICDNIIIIREGELIKTLKNYDGLNIEDEFFKVLGGSNV